ncbi:DUF309 domain-containing protein, partial [Staphylococcus epidermidis]|nr:DUF309 domain-containing protein [Staphylococcus epidermidis]
MDQSLMDYYYQFHKLKHYSLCHEILKVLGNSKNPFKKM